jgi:hypothetical protein
VTAIENHMLRQLGIFKNHTFDRTWQTESWEIDSILFDKNAFGCKPSVYSDIWIRTKGLKGLVAKFLKSTYTFSFSQ